CEKQPWTETIWRQSLRGAGFRNLALTCSLIFMADFGESRYFKPAKIAMNKNNLIIRTSDVEIAFKITK
ncbi:hypothetical protein BEA11_24365, partial [Escherichia coli]|nr:hypothetical protein [Shigella sonnei]MBW0143130.1 hypothetical protein [Escherichia coli]EGE1795631.1 hypothetical protein [Shigella sonnei]EGE1923756.1 hypothetical protein [Shigella sonnei]MBW1091069.1 hypothetical protein [Escherichia coli]